MKIRFNDSMMQRHYESLIKDGYHWKAAERKTIQIFQEYDESKTCRAGSAHTQKEPD